MGCHGCKLLGLVAVGTNNLERDAGSAWEHTLYVHLATSTGNAILAQRIHFLATQLYESTIWSVRATDKGTKHNSNLHAGPRSMNWQAMDGWY